MVLSSTTGNSAEEENAQASSPLVELVGSIENDEIDHTVEDFEVDVNLHTLTTHSIIYDSPRTSSLRLVISLFVILIQIFAVTQLTLDLFHPKCSVHNDCPGGTYCGFRNQTLNKIDPENGRCFDCGNGLQEGLGEKLLMTDIILSYEYDFNETVVFMNTTNISQNVSCIDELRSDIEAISYPWSTSKMHPWDAHDHSNILEEGYRIFDIYERKDYEYYICTIVHHCMQTKVIEGKCDFVRINKDFVDFTSGTFFLLVSFLLAAIIFKDISASRLEERYLRLAHYHNYKLTPEKPIMVNIMTSLLVFRRLGLPVLVVQAAISLMTTEPMRPTQILLNALSIAFILEADDVIGILFVPNGSMCNIQKSCVKFHQDCAISLTTFRADVRGDYFIAAANALMLLVGVFGIEKVVARLGSYVAEASGSTQYHIESEYSCYDVMVGIYSLAFITFVIIEIGLSVNRGVSICQQRSDATDSLENSYLRHSSAFILALLMISFCFGVEGLFEQNRMQFSAVLAIVFFVSLVVYIFIYYQQKENHKHNEIEEEEEIDA